MMSRPVISLDPAKLSQVADVIKCLGHPLRLVLLEAMEQGDRTVTELQEHTGTTQTTVSQQLAVLRGHGVVTARRDGPFVRYSISEPKVRHILDCIRGCDASAQES